MSSFIAAFGWIFDPAHNVGPDGIPARLGEHMLYTLLTLVIAAAVAVPIGFLIGHTGRGRGLAVQISGGLRSLPTLGLVILLALLLGIGLIGPLIALVVIAIPPLLAGAYAGVESVDRATVDAARAVGMTEWQILWKVEVPIGLPLIVGGLRSAALQAIATWTVAAYIPLGGLGRYLYDALPLRDYPQMLAGAILVIALALVVDGLFAIVQRLVTPRGVSEGRVSEVHDTMRSASGRGAVLAD
ncbi:ABC transporter permease [Microbacterium sp. STN6]|uniref:ABC transporter permease n=1 Tax=Microbacterium sp. STN6 TaxID=2995588 RepID=UPI002260A587|nr:ABC transporter permease [Microbacterium sp. STN6]MCX7522287.1 ABC transporter permease [Microbacterium sp. STN6]